MKHYLLVLLATALFIVPVSAAPITYTAVLSGANENPATASLGTGFAIVTIDSAANTMLVNVTFSNLTSGDTASHIHCCVLPPGNAGVATITPTFTGFPTGVTAGTYSNLFDLTQAGSYNPAFITANGASVAQAEAVLIAGIAAGQSYLNIHTTNFPGGEIRGYLTAVPEPGSLSLLAVGSLLLVAKRFRRV